MPVLHNLWAAASTGRKASGWETDTKSDHRAGEAAAQDAWDAYRDAELTARFPKPDKHSIYGSIYPFCPAGAEAALTWARSAQLSQWLVGTYEGDACAGSIPIVE